MDRSYNEEMEILLNDFNNELKSIIGEKSIEELGFIDLRRIKHEFEALHELNLDLQDRARKDPDFDITDLRDLLNDGDVLYEDNRVSLVEVENQINAKTALFRSKIEERRKLKNERDKNQRVIKDLGKALDSLKIGENRFGTNVPEAYKAAITQLENSIKQFEELNEDLEKRIEQIEKDIEILRFGGRLPELDKIKEETKGISKEEVETVNKIIDKEMTEEEMLDEINKNLPKEPEKKEEKTEEKVEEKTEEKTEEKKETVEEIEDMTRGFAGPGRRTTARPATPPPAAPQPLTPEPETLEPRTANRKGTLADLRASGRLPGLSDRELMGICAALGINTAELGMDTIINNDQIDRLINDKDIKQAFQNEKIIGKHNAMYDQYGQLSQEYQELQEQEQVQGSRFQGRIERNSNDVEARMADYMEDIETINLGNSHENFDIKSGSRAEKRVAGLDKRSDKVNAKIRSSYQKLDALREKRSRQQTTISQQRSDARIERIQAKIERLRAKENKLSGKQFAIMEAQTDKYIDKRSKDFELLQERLMAEKEILKYENDLGLATGNKLGDRIERARLSHGMNKLDHFIDRVSKKENRCDRRLQATFSLVEMQTMPEELTEEPVALTM